MADDMGGILTVKANYRRAGGTGAAGHGRGLPGGGGAPAQGVALTRVSASTVPP